MTAGPPARGRLETWLGAALAAVDAGAAVARHVARDASGGLRIAGEPLPAGAPLRLIAAGKAAVPMARAFLEAAGPVAAGGVFTKDGHAGPVDDVPVRETAHPVPDARSERAGRACLALAAGAGPEDVLVVLLSGGASSLLACPAEGLGLADLAATTEALLASGADIEETNCVRKHLSALAGGRLARAFGGAALHLLAVSDVPGDRLDVIGSGPCSADPSRFDDALGVLAARGIEGRVPPAVREHLRAGARGEHEDTPGPGDPSLARVHARVVARNADALDAAAEAARKEGVRVALDPEPLTGEARDAGPALVARARAAAGGAPLLWLAGGETTVTFDERTVPFERAGRGGRNMELALAAALSIEGERDVGLLAVGTDGSDGPTDAAGAFADGGSVARGRARGVDARDALAHHDSYTFWESEGGLLRTGPTGTNVMDVAFVELG
jgi:glycerate-2-kinase